MDSNTLKYQIGLTLIKGVGIQLAKNLIAYVGSAEGIFKEKQRVLSTIPNIGAVISKEIATTNALEKAEKEVEFILKNGIKTYFFTDKSYPFRLKECYDAPILLYQKGDINLNGEKMIGMVGTRNITTEGKEICQEIVHDLSVKIPHISIVSGLAYGVDITAHKSAINAHTPTIGVMGHGLDRIYPALHKSTANRMIDTNGGLLTEYLSGSKPERNNFVMRNRIIAGLCDAVIIVESAQKGGSLITAEYANNYNRDVFAIPGSVKSTFSVGCNLLIRDNKASLMTCADDLIRAMNWEEKSPIHQSKPQQMTLFENLTKEEEIIISHLKKTPQGINVNELTVSLKIPYSQLSTRLLEMEFKGLVKCMPGGMYKIH